MATLATHRDTIDDLYRVDGKAELVNGRIITFMPTAELPSTVAFEIAVRLREIAKSTGRGRAYTDGIGYTVPELPSGRESFSPDASYFDGPLPQNPMRFIEGAPTVAVEVRSEGDYGTTAEEEMAAKRADYFLAGTSVVWDVDPLAKTVAIYRVGRPDSPDIRRAGDVVDAEPALEGWRISVDDIFAASIT